MQELYFPFNATIVTELHPVILFQQLVNMHTQVAKSFVFALAGGSTCISVRLLGM